jgi:hypothetical protein
MYTKSFNQGWLAKDLTSRAFDAAGVGAMFLCMVNFCLIIFIGVREQLSCCCCISSDIRWHAHSNDCKRDAWLNVWRVAL